MPTAAPSFPGDYEFLCW